MHSDNPQTDAHKSQRRVSFVQALLVPFRKAFPKPQPPPDDTTPAFDMVVVGSGGGPDETDLSAYLIKPHTAAWEDGIIALEAGCGRGTLRRLLEQNPKLFASPSQKRSYTSNEIYSYVRCFLISHAHLDHVSSLVLSAGSLTGPRKSVYAAHQTLKDLESIFSDRIWPNLASWKEQDEPFKLLYSPLRADGVYRPVFQDVSVLMMPLSHGKSGGAAPGSSGDDDGSGDCYASAAFFVRHDTTSREFLFFGDVEPDSLAAYPQTRRVWRTAAPKIPDTLSTVFIECSWTTARRDGLLYGHLNPQHLLAELIALATEVVLVRGFARRTSASSSPSSPTTAAAASLLSSPPFTTRIGSRANTVLPPESLRGALNGLRVHIIHCKDSTEPIDRPISHIICDQIRELVDAAGLGAEILPTDQGMRIEI